MASPNYSYQKRQRELAKKQKKEAKLARKAEKGNVVDDEVTSPDDAHPDDQAAAAREGEPS